MNKVSRFFVVTIGVSALLCLILYSYYHKYHYYESWQDDSFEINKGETVSVALSANGSIGYSPHWVNKAKCNNIVLSSRNYSSSFRQFLGYDGVGGTITFIFEGIAPGVDTVKFAKCWYDTNCNEAPEKDFDIENNFIIKVSNH